MKKPDVSNRDIVTRLENWAACQRGRRGGAMVARETRRSSPYGGQGYTCMTDVVCNIMRMAAEGPTGRSSVQSNKLDFDDAATITRAWQRCNIRHKTLLKDFYALGRPPHILCRELSIKHWPASHWNRELRQAQEAIEDAASNEGNR